jgi:hypothetical protein
MSRTPSDDVTGGGPDSYRGNPNVRTPALGRSSRDLASDTGPAGASEATFGAGDRETELLAGRAAERPGETEERLGGREKRKRSPEVDPDTRLGLHPTIKSEDLPDGQVRSD